MKKLFLLFLSICFSVTVKAQLPTAPKQIEFANVTINLTPESQKLIDAEISKLILNHNKYQDVKLEKMQVLFPIIEKLLDEENVPEDIKYLSVLESSLNPDLVSTSNAVGYWQFKEATARELGLRIDDNVDERKNLTASTQAAANYLKRNNLIYKNWISSLLTYNLGASGASSIIPADWSFASEITFDATTHVYLNRILAHKIAYDYKLGRMKETSKKAVLFPTNGKTLIDIASELNVDATELAKNNSWLKAAVIPQDKIYNVLVMSKGTETATIQDIVNKESEENKINVGYPKLKRLTTVSTSANEPILYSINDKKGILAQPGNEIAQLASQSHISIKKMLKYNDMSETDIAKPGQIYYLKKKNKKADVEFHTLAANQTLWDVSQIYGIRERKLLRFNRIKDKNATLLPGSVLYLTHKRPRRKPLEIVQLPTEVVPAVKEVEPSDAMAEKDDASSVDEQVETTKTVPKTYEDGLKLNEPVTTNTTKDVIPPKPEPIETPIIEKTNEYNNSHKVLAKETWYSISKKYGMTVDDLKAANNKVSNKTLEIGQLLNVSKINSVSTVVSNPKIKNNPDVKSKPPVIVPTEKPIIKNSSTEPMVILPSDKTTNATSNNGYHTVAIGETMYSISQKYKTTVVNIQNINGINNYAISVGQKLKVPKNGIVSENSHTNNNNNSSQIKKHLIEPSETLYSISRKYGVTVEELRTWNNINNNSISSGTYLKIKK